MRELLDIALLPPPRLFTTHLAHLAHPQARLGPPPPPLYPSLSRPKPAPNVRPPQSPPRRRPRAPPVRVPTVAWIRGCAVRAASRLVCGPCEGRADQRGALLVPLRNFLVLINPDPPLLAPLASRSPPVRHHPSSFTKRNASLYCRFPSSTLPPTSPPLSPHHPPQTAPSSAPPTLKSSPPIPTCPS